jgi:hypothetical protein
MFFNGSGKFFELYIVEGKFFNIILQFWLISDAGGPALSDCRQARIYLGPFGPFGPYGPRPPGFSTYSGPPAASERAP